MRWRLDYRKERLSAKAEAPFVRVNVLRYVRRPRFRVQLGETVEQLPEQVIVFFDRPCVRHLPGQQDKRRVRTQITRLGQVRGQCSSQGANVAGVGEVIGIDEQVPLIICFEALGSVDAREYKLLVKEHLCKVIVRRALPSAFGKGLSDLRSTRHLSMPASRR